METEHGSYLGRLWGALLNRRAAVSHAVTQTVPEPQSAAPVVTIEEAAAKEAGHVLELQERDRQIAAMRAEYESLQAAGERHSTEAGDKALEELFRRLANTLTQISRLDGLHKQGRTVEAGDLFALASDMERELARAGLERIGAALETAKYDSKLHQRLSGSAPNQDEPVTIVSPGYVYREKVLLRATVTVGSRG